MAGLHSIYTEARHLQDDTARYKFLDSIKTEGLPTQAAVLCAFSDAKFINEGINIGRILSQAPKFSFEISSELLEVATQAAHQRLSRDAAIKLIQEHIKLYLVNSEPVPKFLELRYARLMEVEPEKSQVQAVKAQIDNEPVPVKAQIDNEPVPWWYWLLGALLVLMLILGMTVAIWRLIKATPETAVNFGDSGLVQYFKRGWDDLTHAWKHNPMRVVVQSIPPILGIIWLWVRGWLSYMIMGGIVLLIMYYAHDFFFS